MKALKIFFNILLLPAMLNFASATDYYWVNGEGGWKDYTNHWATSSGGSTFHTSVPKLTDNVFFDANSFPFANDTVTVDTTAECLNMDWTGCTNNPTIYGSNSIIINGSLILVPGMTFGLSSNIRFVSPLPGNVVDFAGLIPATLWGVEFSGYGEWTLQSDIDVSTTFGQITHSGGTLNTNNFDLKCGMFNSWFNVIPRTINLTGSKVYCNNLMINPGADLNFNAGTSEIILGQAWFMGNDMTFYDFTFRPSFPGEINLMGSATFHTLNIASDSVRGIVFESGKTTQIFDLITGARCDIIKTIRSMNPGMQATIKKITGLVQEDYLAIKDIKVIGGATFITDNGINLGNVTNWTINSTSGTTLYWVGGKGLWDDPNHWSTTSGGVYPSGNTCPPSINDNVVFDANSFSLPNDSVKVYGNIYCNNMTWTGVTNNPAFVTSWNNVNINGSLILSAGMTANISGNINFTASGAGNTIFSGGHSLGAGIVFDGTGTWTFTDDFTSTNSFTHNKGTVIINDRQINVYSYYSSTNFARTLTFTTGIFTCSSTWSISNSNNFTLNAGSSTIYLNGYSFTSTNLGYNSLILNNATYTYIYGSSSFAGIFNTNTGDIYFESGMSNQTTAFTSDGDCGNVITIHSTIAGTQAELVLLSPATITYCSLKDMLVSNAALNANSCIDEGNNTGITFVPLASVNYYWIGGTGIWNDAANWSLSSGGAANPGGCIPTMADNVFFDAASGLGGHTITINADAYCRNFTFSANNSFLAGTSTLNVYGSFTLTNTLTLSYSGSLYFRSNSPGNTINTAGRTIRGQVYFDGNGDWTLQGALTTWVANYKSIYFYKGTLSTNNFNVTTYYFSSYTTGLRQLNLGSSTINVTYWNISDGLNMTIVPGTSTINVSTGSFEGGGLVYNNVNINTTSYASIYGSNTFNNLSMATCTHLSIEGGTTQTFSNINFPDGTGCAAYFDLASTQPGIPATFSKDGVALNKSWLRITDVKANGTATFNAANSMGIGDCSGWNIVSGGTVDYYWIGNGGNWNDPAHWSYTSGGIPNPALCIPDADDNVYFDAGSFTLPNQIVSVNVNAYCMNMNWTGVTQNPEFTGWSSTYIGGSLTLNNAINHSYQGTYYFTNNSPATITSSGKTIYGIVIAGNSTVTLTDDLNLNWSGLTLNSGAFITNNFDINGLSGGFSSGSASVRELTLGSSDLYFYSWSIADPTNLVLNPGTSNIHLGNNCWQFIGGGLTYNNVFIEKNQWSSTQISGDNTFNILFFEPGCRVSFEKNSTQTTTNLFATGTQTDPIEIMSNEVGTAFDIVQTTVFCSDWLILNDCHVSGSTFYAGVHSTDNGGNAGWTWSGVTANDQYPAALCENTAGSGTASGVNLTLLQPAIDGGAPGHIHVWFSDPLLSIPVPVPTNVTVSDGQMFYDLVSNGTCNNVATAIYTVNPKPVISLAGTDPLCHGNNNGEIDATITVGTPPFTYLWSNSAATEDISGLIIGTYTLTVTDTYGCVNSAGTTLNEPATLAVAESHVNISCFGVCDGSIDITASGGTSPYIYMWTGPSFTSTSEDISALCAGTYDVTVTDANSCTATISVVITEPALLTAVITSNDVLCNGNCDGTISITPSGGTLPYSYAWTGPSFTSSTEDISGLCPGTYDLTLTDAHGCTFTASEVISEPALLIYSETHTDPTCNGDCNGQITVTPSGGTSPYTMIWSTLDVGFSINNLCAGNYSGTITDANGCTVIVSVILTEPDAITFSETHTDILCSGFCSGAIDITASGGTSPYNYLWDGPGAYASTDEDLTGLCAGNYDLSITDDNGCFYSTTVTLTEPLPWTVTETHTNVLCNGVCSGEIDITVSGATSPYTYSWEGPASFVSTSEDQTALCAGTYNLTITDDVSCTYLLSVNITEPVLLEITSQTSTNITCNNLNDGTVTVVASGGNGTLQYNIGAGNQVSGSFTGLSAGSYVVTVTDANGCSVVSNTYTMTNPAALAIVSETYTSITCAGLTDGTITVVASGGTSPLMYDLGAGPQANGLFTGLAVNTYTVTVTDAHGCTIASNLINIGGPTPILIYGEFHTDLTCFESGDGTINIQVTGGIGPYEFTLGSLTQSGSIFVGLDAGSYQVLITDANGCQEYSSVIDLEEPTHIDITEVHTNVTSCGATDGTITLIVSGGTPGYTFNWENSSGTFTSTSQDLTGLAGGIYYLTVTDDTLCTETLTVIISETGAPTVTAVVTNNTCYGDCEGTISTTTTGGTPPYTFGWSNGYLGDTIIGLCAAPINLTITDDAGCNAYLIEEITQPDSIIITTVVTAETCHSACDGTVTVNASGGTIPYSYDFGSGPAGSNTASGLCPGVYFLTVTDNNGCSDSASYTIDVYSLTLSFTNTNVTCFGLCNGMSSVSVTGSTSPYTYLWSNSDVTSITTNLCAGIYYVTVTDISGCTTADSIFIIEPTALAVTMSSTDDHDGIGDGTATAIPTGGTLPYAIYWSSGGATNTETNLVAGMYFVTVTDANGCEIIDSVEVLLNVGVSFNSGNSVINIYPNPFHDILNVRIENLNEEIIISVLDISGRNVITRKILPGNIVHSIIEMEGQAEGMYFIQITGTSINHKEKMILR